MMEVPSHRDMKVNVIFTFLVFTCLIYEASVMLPKYACYHPFSNLYFVAGLRLFLIFFKASNLVMMCLIINNLESLTKV